MGSYKKKLFIVLLLFLLINSFVCSSVNAATAVTEDYTFNIDLIQLMKNEQDFCSQVFFYYLSKSNITSAQKETLKGYLQTYNVYFRWYCTADGSTNNMIICFYDKNINYNQMAITPSLEFETDVTYLYDPNYLHNVSGYTISCYPRSYVNLLNNTYAAGLSSSNVNIPTFLIGYIPSGVNGFIDGIDPSSSYWSMLFNAINDNTEATEDTTQAVNNLRNDFNEEESDDDYDFPTSNPTTDPTSSGIDNIFNMFYMRINSWNALGINVPIPFTGKSFTINPDITENIINGWTPSTQIATVFKTLLSGVWYYLLGRYIVKDVQHYVDGLQTGDILTKSDTNIKTEML